MVDTPSPIDPYSDAESPLIRQVTSGGRQASVASPSLWAAATKSGLPRACFKSDNRAGLTLQFIDWSVQEEVPVGSGEKIGGG